MEFKDFISEARQLNTINILKEMEKIPSFKKRHNSHSTADGVMGYFEGKDGNGYAVEITHYPDLDTK